MKTYLIPITVVIAAALMSVAFVFYQFYCDTPNYNKALGDVVRRAGRYEYKEANLSLIIEGTGADRGLLSYRLCDSDGDELLASDPSKDQDSMYIRWHLVLDKDLSLWVWCSDYSGCTYWKSRPEGKYSRIDVDEENLGTLVDEMPAQYLQNLPRSADLAVP